MAKDKKVEQITNLEDDFAQWYTDICRKAELVEYASVKGFTILRPYGFAIWENMQRLMDAEFKKTGHENVAMPVLIPESLLKKDEEVAVDGERHLPTLQLRQALRDGEAEAVALGRARAVAAHKALHQFLGGNVQRRARGVLEGHDRVAAGRPRRVTCP